MRIIKIIFQLGIFRKKNMPKIHFVCLHFKQKISARKRQWLQGRLWNQTLLLMVIFSEIYSNSFLRPIYTSIATFICVSLCSGKLECVLNIVCTHAGYRWPTSEAELEGDQLKCQRWATAHYWKAKHNLPQSGCCYSTQSAGTKPKDFMRNIRLIAHQRLCLMLRVFHTGMPTYREQLTMYY